MDMTEGIRKLILAGIGAGAATYEKASQVVDDLVKKGEVTVEQGKSLNQELRHNMKGTYDRTKDAVKKSMGESRENAAKSAEKSSGSADEQPEDDKTVDSTAKDVTGEKEAADKVQKDLDEMSSDLADKTKEIIHLLAGLSQDEVDKVKGVIDTLNRKE